MAAAGWGDEEDELPENEIHGPDEDGVTTTIEYRMDEDGRKWRTTRKTKTVQMVTQTPVSAIERRERLRKPGKKFGDAERAGDGPEESVTMPSVDEIKLNLSFTKPGDKKQDDEDDPMRRLRGQGNIILCRICGKQGEHWTRNCPFKDKPGYQPGGAGPAGQDKEKEPSGQLGRGSGAYVAPGRRGEGVAPTEEENTTLRVSNLSDQAREDDLRDLFRPFGLIRRIFLKKDRKTGLSRGYAFVTFSMPEEARRAKEHISVPRTQVHGHKYDHLVLEVEWANPVRQHAY